MGKEIKYQVYFFMTQHFIWKNIGLLIYYDNKTYFQNSVELRNWSKILTIF